MFRESDDGSLGRLLLIPANRLICSIRRLVTWYVWCDDGSHTCLFVWAGISVFPESNTLHPHFTDSFH